MELPFLVCSVDDTPVVNLINDVVKAMETVVIAGRTIQPLEVSLPLEVVTQGVCNVLIEQQSSNVPNHLLFPRTLTRVTNGSHAVIQIINTSPKDITLYKNTTLGCCTPVQNLLAISTENQTVSIQTASTQPLSYIDLSSSNLSHSQKQQLQELLNKYSDLFASPGGPLG